MLGANLRADVRRMLPDRSMSSRRASRPAGYSAASGARSRRWSWPSANAMMRAITGQAAIVGSPKAKPPVASLIQPMTKGPKKPARLPIELIAAMPGATAAPARNAVGRRPEDRLRSEEAESPHGQREHLHRRVGEEGRTANADRRERLRAGEMNRALPLKIRSPPPPEHAAKPTR